MCITPNKDFYKGYCYYPLFEAIKTNKKEIIEYLIEKNFDIENKIVVKFNKNIDIVMMPKVGIEAIENQELHQQLDFAWQKLQRLAKKHG